MPGGRLRLRVQFPPQPIRAYGADVSDNDTDGNDVSRVQPRALSLGVEEAASEQ